MRWYPAGEYFSGNVRHSPIRLRSIRSVFKAGTYLQLPLIMRVCLRPADRRSCFIAAIALLIIWAEAPQVSWSAAVARCVSRCIFAGGTFIVRSRHFNAPSAGLVALRFVASFVLDRF